MGLGSRLVPELEYNFAKGIIQGHGVAMVETINFILRLWRKTTIGRRANIFGANPSETVN
jgi:hypothetical protein